jgi:hypothetical protein
MPRESKRRAQSPLLTTLVNEQPIASTSSNPSPLSPVQRRSKRRRVEGSATETTDAEPSTSVIPSIQPKAAKNPPKLSKKKSFKAKLAAETRINVRAIAEGLKPEQKSTISDIASSIMTVEDMLTSGPPTPNSLVEDPAPSSSKLEDELELVRKQLKEKEEVSDISAIHLVIASFPASGYPLTYGTKYSN